MLQVARAGRFGTKGLAISFISEENDAKVLNDVQDRFEVNVSQLPAEIDMATYSELILFFQKLKGKLLYLQRLYNQRRIFLWNQVFCG